MSRMQFPAVLFFAASLLSLSMANPHLPRPFTEIHIVDQKHFTIEFDCSEGLPQPYPDSIDDIYLLCASGHPELGSMTKCAGAIAVDTGGIALISEKDFPGFVLKPGEILYFGYDGYVVDVSLNLPYTFSSEKTFIQGRSETTCCDYYSGTSMCYTCSQPVFKEVHCSSLGIRNGDVGFSIVGYVCDSNDNVVGDVQIDFADGAVRQHAMPSSGSSFYFSSVEYCIPCSLQVRDLNGAVLKDTILGPFPEGSISDWSRSVHVVLEVDVPPSALFAKPPVKPTAARVLAASVKNGITFTLSASSVVHSEVQIYSADGKKIRKLPFSSHGAGTYTVYWNGKNDRNRSVPPGSYTVRILTGRESLCTGLLQL